MPTHTPRQPPAVTSPGRPEDRNPPPVDPLYSRWRIRLWAACALVLISSAVVFGIDVGGVLPGGGGRLPAIIYDYNIAAGAVAVVIPALDYGLWRYTNHAQQRFLAEMATELDARLADLKDDNAATRDAMAEQLVELAEQVRRIAGRVEDQGERLQAALSHGYYSGYADAVADSPSAARSRVVPLAEQRRNGGPGTRPGA